MFCFYLCFRFCPQRFTGNQIAKVCQNQPKEYENTEVRCKEYNYSEIYSGIQNFAPAPPLGWREISSGGLKVPSNCFRKSTSEGKTLFSLSCVMVLVTWLCAIIRSTYGNLETNTPPPKKNLTSPKIGNWWWWWWWWLCCCWWWWIDDADATGDELMMYMMKNWWWCR